MAKPKRECGGVQKRAWWEIQTSVHKACNCLDIQAIGQWTWLRCPWVCSSVVLPGLKGSEGKWGFPFKALYTLSSFWKASGLFSVCESPPLGGVERDGCWRNWRWALASKVQCFVQALTIKVLSTGPREPWFSVPSLMHGLSSQKSPLPLTGVSHLLAQFIIPGYCMGDRNEPNSALGKLRDSHEQTTPAWTWEDTYKSHNNNNNNN